MWWNGTHIVAKTHSRGPFFFFRLPGKCNCQIHHYKSAVYHDRSQISIYKRLTSVYFKFVCVVNHKFVNVTLFDIARLVNLLDLSRLLIKNLNVIFLHFKLFYFLYMSLFYNFVNYKVYFALFNVVKITLFKSLFNVLNYFLYRNIECVSGFNNDYFNVYVIIFRVNAFIILSIVLNIYI